MIKSHLSLKDAVGKRLFGRQDAKVVVLKTWQNVVFFTLGYCNLGSPLWQIVPIPMLIYLVKSLIGDFYPFPLKMQVQSASPLALAARGSWSESMMLPLSSLQCNWGGSNPAGVKAQEEEAEFIALTVGIHIVLGPYCWFKNNIYIFPSSVLTSFFLFSMQKALVF